MLKLAEFTLRPSRLLLGYLFVSHLVILVVVCLLPLSALSVLLFAVVILCSLLWSVWRWRVETLPTVLLRDGDWFLCAEDCEEPVAPSSSHYASDWLLVFRLKPASGRSRILLVVRDSLDRDDYRCLRAVLRLVGKAEVSF